jgi:hypothetical protein
MIFSGEEDGNLYFTLADAPEGGIYTSFMPLP